MHDAYDPYDREPDIACHPTATEREPEFLVELKTDLTVSSRAAGGSATAYIIKADGTRISASHVTVYSRPGDGYFALGADNAGSGRGAIGLARRSARTGNLELVSLQWRESWLRKGTLAADLDAATSTAQVTMTDAGGDLTPDTSPITAANLFAQAGASSAPCVVFRDPLVGWVLVACTPPTASMLSQINYDASTGVARYKTRTVPGCRNDESGWNTLFAAAAAGSDLQRDSTTTSTPTSDHAPSKFGQVCHLSATVSHSAGVADPTGFIAFVLDGVPLGTGSVGGGGTATLDIALPNSGSLVAVYQGDSSYNPSTSSDLTCTVNPAITTAALTASPSSITYGDTCSLTAVVSVSSPGAGTPLGTIEFYDGATLLQTLPTTGTTTWTAAKLAAGSRSITAVFVPANAAQFATSTSSAATVTVAKAHLHVTASDATKTYGAGNPTFHCTITGFVGTDGLGVLTGSPAYTCSATSTSDVGSYAITPAVGTLAASNYDFPGGNFTAGTLSVTPAAATATAADKTATFNHGLPAFTGSLSGMLNGDTLSLSFTCSAHQGSPKGTYAIEISASGAALGNYSMTYRQGTLTITS